MNTSLHHLLLRGLVAVLLFASMPCSAAVAQAGGQTRFTVRVDAQAAMVVRAWREAHGLDAPGPHAVAPTPYEPAAIAAAFSRRCRDAGGSVAGSTAPGPSAPGGMCV
ncbi:MAG: hypothetical protein KGN77_01220 [Xanthomonadaceae bacterium]|nr:hypothetical protein [Xanthomonadaceae bacterium]MDE1963992.1 hypothetical protein [Xanthomonadaceae bacterium]